MIFEKSLRKLYNLIFKGSPQKRLKYDIKRSSFIKESKPEKQEAVYRLKLKNYRNSFFIRNRPSSDYDVLRQVIFEAEYGMA